MGALKYKDATGTWITVPTTGPIGPTGPPGGAPGPTGPEGPPGGPLPLGGLAGAALMKASDTDQDVKWSDGEAFIRVGFNGGYSFESGGGMYWRGGGADTATPLTFRECNALQPRIADNNGANERDIMDAVNVRAGTNINVTFLNGFSGAMQFRVTPALVTCHMWQLAKNPASGTATAVKICDYPAGVPAPWAQISVLGVIADNTAIAASNGTVEIQYQTSGVFLKTFSVLMNATNHRLYGGSATWAR